MFQAGRTLLCSVAYDSFNVNSHTDLPTLEKQSVFIHTMLATLIPLNHGVTKEDLHCSAELYARSVLNEERNETHSEKKAEQLTYEALMPQPMLMAPLPRRALADPMAAPGLPPPPRVPPLKMCSEQMKHRDWHVLNHLVSYSGLLEHFQKELGLLESVDPIPVVKTMQIPLTAMHLNQSTVDGNALILAHMHRRCRLGTDGVKRCNEPIITADGYVVLTHGDLGTGERITSLLES
jgi:hypothetical protein